jgi:hypothetical protein
MPSTYSDEITRYGDEIAGERGNHNLSVRFDQTSGFIGINQFDETHALTDRILLSPKQVAELFKFVEKHAKKKRVAA